MIISSIWSVFYNSQSFQRKRVENHKYIQSQSDPNLPVKTYKCREADNKQTYDSYNNINLYSWKRALQHYWRWTTRTWTRRRRRVSTRPRAAWEDRCPGLWTRAPTCPTHTATLPPARRCPQPTATPAPPVSGATTRAWVWVWVLGSELGARTAWLDPRIRGLCFLLRSRQSICKVSIEIWMKFL